MEDLSGHLFAPGDVVDGRFRIERWLGSGGMGQVFEARGLADGSPVALKVLLPELLGNEKSLARFEREIKSTQAIDHPNVLRIVEVLQLEPPGGGLYMPGLVMEYLEGESLADLVEREGPVDEALAISILEQMAAALDAAHRAGIVHRDLKPDNVFLVPSGDSEAASAQASPPYRVVLTDFGVARRRPQVADGGDFSHDSLTASNVVIGTPEFMAPEMLELEDAIPASDLYALGLVAYQMLTGRLPFEDEQPLKALFMRVREPSPSPRLLRPDLDPRLADLVDTCLERRPEDRYASAGAIIDALRGPAPSSRSGLHPQLQSLGRDHYLAAGVAAVMLVLIVVLVVLFASPGAG